MILLVHNHAKQEYSFRTLSDLLFQNQFQTLLFWQRWPGREGFIDIYHSTLSYLSFFPSQSKTVSCKRMASARYEQQQTFLNTFSFRMQCHIYQLKYLIPSPIESAKSVRSRCRSMGYFIWFSRQLKASGKITCKKLLLMFRTWVKTLKLDIWLWSHNPQQIVICGECRSKSLYCWLLSDHNWAIDASKS